MYNGEVFTVQSTNISNRLYVIFFSEKDILQLHIRVPARQCPNNSANLLEIYFIPCQLWDRYPRLQMKVRTPSEANDETRSK